MTEHGPSDRSTAPIALKVGAAVLCWAAAAPGAAQPSAGAVVVYRCPGAVYQQTPCAGGRELRIDPATNALPAPTASDRALAAQWDARADGPWVATLPMPPRMTPTQPNAPAPHGFGGYPVAPWYGWGPPLRPAPEPPGSRPEPIPARPSRSAR